MSIGATQQVSACRVEFRFSDQCLRLSARSVGFGSILLHAHARLVRWFCRFAVHHSKLHSAAIPSSASMSILVSQCLWCGGDIRACAHLLSDRASQTHCLRAQGCSQNKEKRWRCFVCTVDGLANNGCWWKEPRMDYITEHCKRHFVNPNNPTGQQPFMQTPQPAGQQPFVPTPQPAGQQPFLPTPQPAGQQPFVPTPQPAGQQPFVQTPPTVGQQCFGQTDGRVDGIAVSQATTEVTSCVA